MRRIFAGSIIGLLLWVSSLAVACDLSCGFAQFHSDCHSPQMAATESGPAEMTIAGMTMPEMVGADSTDQGIYFSTPRATAAHAVIGEMGPCQRESCDQVQALAAKTNHSTAVQFDLIWAVAGSSHVGCLQTAFHDAREDIAPLGPGIHTPLSMSLRI
jgi:hypothetical protein